MIREPLAGHEAVCPVSPDTVMALASPRRVIAGLLHAHDLPADAFGANRSLQLPGFSVAVGEMAAAVQRAGGDAAHGRIRWRLDPQTQQIISSWPQALLARRAEALGFTADRGIDEVVQAFIEDDLDSQKRLLEG
jgi:nucleoside-diphosphate-sugar epimerase